MKLCSGEHGIAAPTPKKRRDSPPARGFLDSRRVKLARSALKLPSRENVYKASIDRHTRVEARSSELDIDALRSKCVAPLMPTPLGNHVHHSLPGVLSVELILLAAVDAVARILVALLITTSLVLDIH